MRLPTAKGEWVGTRLVGWSWRAGRPGIAAVLGRPPYGPVVEAIAPLVAARPDLLEWLTEPMRRVLALLLPFAPSGDTSRQSDAKRHQVFAAIARLVQSAAHERGAVMALEDLHASDASTLHLAHFLSRAARDAPMLVVMTARHGEASPELARVRASLREQRAGVEIVLRPLARPAVTRIAERAAARSLGAGTIDAIAAVAVGNPFFAEELAATVDDRGGVRVPEHVNDLLDARLGRLPEDSRSVVLFAGVLQDGFSVSDLAAVAGVDRAHADAAVGAALRCGVLEGDVAGVRFRHPLLRDARPAGSSIGRSSSRCTCGQPPECVRAAALPRRSHTTSSTPAARATPCRCWPQRHNGRPPSAPTPMASAG
jgi:hypothetical protein